MLIWTLFSLVYITLNNLNEIDWLKCLHFMIALVYIIYLFLCIFLYSIKCCFTRTSIRVTQRALIVTPPSTGWKEEKAVSKKKMETCVAVRKRKISDVSDSSKIKLSESNDHRPKLKSRKHENCVALGFTANVVGTTTTKTVSCLTTLRYTWQYRFNLHRGSQTERFFIEIRFHSQVLSVFTKCEGASVKGSTFRRHCWTLITFCIHSCLHFPFFSPSFETIGI